MSNASLSVILTTLLLCGCSSFDRATTCPQPPTSLLTPEAPLAKPDDAPAKTQPDVLQQYVDDIGRFESLRLRHAQLAGWVVTECGKD